MKDGMAREKVTLQKMLAVQNELQKEKKVMEAEIVNLRRRAESAENEARVWKAISEQNSAVTSKAASPCQSSTEGDSEGHGR